MPKLTIFKHDKRVLEEAQDICQILAAHNQFIPLSVRVAQSICKLRQMINGEAILDDGSEEEPPEIAEGQTDAEEK